MIDIIKQLSVFNRIIFLAKSHKYCIDNKPTERLSVTGLIDLYKPKFETDKWANLKAKNIGLTTEEIKADWKQNNLYSTTLGTILHQYIDNYYNNKIIPYNHSDVESSLGHDGHMRLRETLSKLIGQFNNFYNFNKHIIPIKNELVVGDIQTTKICGTIDMLAYNDNTKEFEIYDFKTNKSFHFTKKFNEMLKAPISHLDNCEYTCYSLQLSLYKHFIEKYTGIKISKNNVVWFNSNNEDYQIIELLDLKSEVSDILNHFESESIV